MKLHEVTDFHLAIALVSLGHELVDIDRTDLRRQAFQFKYTPEIEKNTKDFFQSESHYV